MDFTKLAQQQQQAFDENGFLVVREAIDRPTIDRLTATGDRLMEDFFADPDQFYAQVRKGLVLK